MRRAAGVGAPGRRRRLAWIVSFIVVATAVVGIAAWWFVLREDTAEAGAQPVVGFTDERAQELSGLMTSGDEAQLRQALVLPPDQPLDPTLAASLGGLTLNIDTASYRPTSAKTASVEASATDAAGATTRWALELLLTDVGWQVLHTVPQDTD